MQTVVLRGNGKKGGSVAYRFPADAVTPQKINAVVEFQLTEPLQPVGRLELIVCHSLVEPGPALIDDQGCFQSGAVMPEPCLLSEEQPEDAARRDDADHEDAGDDRLRIIAQPVCLPPGPSGQRLRNAGKPAFRRLQRSHIESDEKPVYRKERRLSPQEKQWDARESASIK